MMQKCGCFAAIIHYHQDTTRETMSYKGTVILKEVSG